MPIQSTFTYLNHAGKKSVRTIDVECVEFIRSPGFGYQSGWFLSGFDSEKQARRSFALDRIIFDDEGVPPFFKLFTL